MSEIFDQSKKNAAKIAQDQADEDAEKERIGEVENRKLAERKKKPTELAKLQVDKLASELEPIFQEFRQNGWEIEVNKSINKETGSISGGYELISRESSFDPGGYEVPANHSHVGVPCLNFRAVKKDISVNVEFLVDPLSLESRPSKEVPRMLFRKSSPTKKSEITFLYKLYLNVPHTQSFFIDRISKKNNRPYYSHQRPRECSASSCKSVLTKDLVELLTDLEEYTPQQPRD